MSKKSIEELEDEIIQSRVSEWDAETFLAERHRRKIEALEKTEQRWGAFCAEIKAEYDEAALKVGRIVILLPLFGIVIAILTFLGFID